MEYQSAQINCPSTETSPNDNVRYPLLDAKRNCALSDSSSNVMTKDLSDNTNAKAKQFSKLSSPEMVSCVSLETPQLKSPIANIKSQTKEYAINVQEDVYGRNVPTSMPVQLRHDCLTSSPCTEQQLLPELLVVKEVLIELIEPHAYNSYDTQLEFDARACTNIVPNVVFPKSTKFLSGTDVNTSIETSFNFETKVGRPVQENVEAELSPTTDEYQEEMHFGDDSKDAVYEYDIFDTDRHLKYIPPAPSPAPLMAPLAVLDIDTVDDEILNELTPVKTQTTALNIEEQRRRRKKRNTEVKKNSSFDDKDKRNENATASAHTAPSEIEHNPVCPWENQNVSTSDDTFVKTYATLGYL